MDDHLEAVDARLQFGLTVEENLPLPCNVRVLRRARQQVLLAERLQGLPPGVPDARHDHGLRRVGSARLVDVKTEIARLHVRDTHGTGCVLSAAIAAYLAGKKGLAEAVLLGKELVTHAIENGLRIGSGVGPCDPLSA